MKFFECSRGESESKFACSEPELTGDTTFCGPQAHGGYVLPVERLARGRRIGKSSRNSKSRFLGVLFIHPPGKYWLTWEELGKIRKLLGRHMELVSGVLVSSDNGVAPYPVYFRKIGSIGTDMEIEDDEGFICSQSRSALDLLLRRAPG